MPDGAIQRGVAPGAGHTGGRARHWARLSLSSKRLICVGALMLLVMASAVGLMMWELRDVTRSDVRRNVGTLGIAIGEQTTRSVQAVELALNNWRRQIAADGIDTPEDFRTRLHTEALHATLRERDAALPQVDAFTIIGADGKLVNFSRQWPIPPTDLSDRDYFKYLSTHDDPAAFISLPVQNRGNGTWTVYVVTRVNGSSGQFLGLLLGAIDLGYFRDFYAALTGGAGTTVTLLRRDGTVLVSYPTTAQIGSQLPAETPWHAIVATGRPGAFDTAGRLAPGQRIVTVVPLSEYPLVVNVSVLEWAALAGWRRAAALAALGTVCAVLCVAWLLRALLQQLSKLETSETSLAGQNARLEASRAQIESQARELENSRGQLAVQSAALSTTLAHMSQGIMMVDQDRHVVVHNARMAEMLDLPHDLLARHPTLDEVVAYQTAHGEFVHGHMDPNFVPAVIPRHVSTTERWRPNGRSIEVHSVPLPDGGMVRTYTDTTARRLSEERVRYFAHHDDLTRCVNRVMFQQNLERAIDGCVTTGRKVAVLYLDLDRFKQVNDTSGHAAGDALLVQVAERLRTVIRKDDTLARMGGDEFAVIQPDIDHPDEALSLAGRVQDAISAPFDISGGAHQIGVSIGIAIAPSHATDSGDLLRSADTALYRAKADGRGVSRVFSPEMETAQKQAWLLEHELRAAVDAQEFELAFQPIIDTLQDRVVCFEALIRWRHPARGLIPPAAFIEAAESTGLIVPIGRLVLQMACEAAVRFPSGVGVTVNLSPVQFSRGDLVADVTGALSATGLPANRLLLEVTEGLLLEHTDAVLETMARLRGLGTRLCLDDFGTGHAGLSYIRRFTFDVIKIDKSFVQDAVSQPDARAIVSAMIGIGSALGLEVIAEGVETQAHLALVTRLGCRHVQGYATGRPMPADDALRLLRAPAAGHAVPTGGYPS